MKSPSYRHALLAAVAASALGGCSLMPKERPVPPPLPASFPTAAKAGAPLAETSLTDWWKGFDDETLNALIAEGLERSPSVRQAVLRIRVARAQGRETLSTYAPTVNGTGRVAYTRSLEGPGLFGSTLGGVGGSGIPTPESEQAIGSYGLSASWEVPLFARIESAVIGARANNRAAEADVRGARASLAADIANAYVDLRTGQNRLAALRQGAEIAESLADILKISADAGITSPADAADARRQAETTRASLADGEIAVRQARNTLATLRAWAPGAEPADTAAPLLVLANVPTITLAGAPAAPADLVRLRPDIARAENAALVAAARVGAARADLLPSLNITGSLLSSENVLGSALGEKVTQAQATPLITIPLLDWGKRFAAIDVSRSQFKSALIDYESAVNQGVAEASLALTQLEQGKLRLDGARAAEAAAQITADGMRASFGAGIASLTDRLRSDQQFLDAQLQRIQAEAAEAKAAIAVYRAFGGGPPDFSGKR